MYLIQFLNKKLQRKCGIAAGQTVATIEGFNTTYDLFTYVEKSGEPVSKLLRELKTGLVEDYTKLVQEHRILPPLDHPDPYHLWITGTGLTHLGSATSREAMHLNRNKRQVTELTDSMKMFNTGLENGKMTGDNPASQPEWFYKGNGLIVENPGGTITSPNFAMGGAEEPEIAGLYIINNHGLPRRVGFAISNEFSDHKMEKINYLYLAHSKLRHCSFGPELWAGELPDYVKGKSRIIRDNTILWEKDFLTGESNMTHNFKNLEYHHFKYSLFRQPGDVHIHFFGTSVLSFTDNIETKNGDVFEIEADAFTKPLRNSLKIL